MTNFVKYIRDYGSAINYDMVYNKGFHKYLPKIFYWRTNKKEYESQILKHNICYTNVIAMQNTILMTKIPNENTK